MNIYQFSHSDAYAEVTKCWGVSAGQLMLHVVLLQLCQRSDTNSESSFPFSLQVYATVRLTCSHSPARRDSAVSTRTAPSAGSRPGAFQSRCKTVAQSELCNTDTKQTTRRPSSTKQDTSFRSWWCISNQNQLSQHCSSFWHPVCYLESSWTTEVLQKECSHQHQHCPACLLYRYLILVSQMAKKEPTWSTADGAAKYSLAHYTAPSTMSIYAKCDLLNISFCMLLKWIQIQNIA